jgi:ABC-type amino acid transport substrate-binding protein
LVEKGALIYVLAASFAHFEYMDKRKADGFEMDLIRAIAGKLQLSGLFASPLRRARGPTQSLWTGFALPERARSE